MLSRKLENLVRILSDAYDMDGFKSPQQALMALRNAESCRAMALAMEGKPMRHLIFITPVPLNDNARSFHVNS